MITQQVDNNIICFDGYDLESKPELLNFLQKKNLENFLENIQQKVVLVLGGDGTMLRAVKENYDKSLPFLGINFGSKGFLLNDKEYLQKENNYTSRQYPLLEIIENDELIGTALNDVNIYSPNGKVVDIDIALENNQETNIKGDGVIISTPAGSTGHNKSYAGPMLPHTSTHLIVTPKGSLTPQSSKVIDGSKILTIENSGRKNSVGINADGNQILVGTNVSLEIKKSKKEVEFLILENYLEQWDNKVLWEQGFTS